MNEDNDDDPIGKALGVGPIEKINNAVSILKAAAHDDSARTDFELARANLIDTIETGKDSLATLSELAEVSQHPRAFEVIAKLMDSIVQANRELLELQIKIRKIDEVDNPHNAHAQTINNNLFVGSTTELQKMIKELKHGSE